MVTQIKLCELDSNIDDLECTKQGFLKGRLSQNFFVKVYKQVIVEEHKIKYFRVYSFHF